MELGVYTESIAEVNEWSAYPSNTMRNMALDLARTDVCATYSQRTHGHLGHLVCPIMLYIMRPLSFQPQPPHCYTDCAPPGCRFSGMPQDLGGCFARQTGARTLPAAARHAAGHPHPAGAASV